LGNMAEIDHRRDDARLGGPGEREVGLQFDRAIEEIRGLLQR